MTGLDEMISRAWAGQPSDESDPSNLENAICQPLLTFDTRLLVARARIASSSRMPKVYLLSRGLDPILGVFTGLLAYVLSEHNPRSAPPAGHTLKELTQWQWAELRKKRLRRALEEERRSGLELEKMRAELEGRSRSTMESKAV